MEIPQAGMYRSFGKLECQDIILHCIHKKKKREKRMVDHSHPPCLLFFHFSFYLLFTKVRHLGHANKRLKTLTMLQMERRLPISPIMAGINIRTISEKSHA